MVGNYKAMDQVSPQSPDSEEGEELYHMKKTFSWTEKNKIWPVPDVYREVAGGGTKLGVYKKNYFPNLRTDEIVVLGTVTSWGFAKGAGEIGGEPGSFLVVPIKETEAPTRHKRVMD